MLVELVNSGIAISQTISKGRHGYGSQFKITADPEIIGTSCFADWWASVVKTKISHDARKKRQDLLSFGKRRSGLSHWSNLLDSKNNDNWNDYVG